MHNESLECKWVCVYVTIIAKPSKTLPLVFEQILMEVIYLTITWLLRLCISS